MKSSKPKEKLNPTEVPDLVFKEKGPFELALNQGVVLQSRANGVIYKGLLTDILPKNHILLTNATIIGRKHSVETPWVIIDSISIQHMHPDGLPIIERDKKKEQ